MNDRQTELKEHSAHIFEMGCMEQRVYLKNDADAVIEAKDAEITEIKQRYNDMDIAHTVHIAKMNAKIEELEANERLLKRALWLSRASEASKEVNYWTCRDESSYAIVDFNVRHETIVSYKAPHNRQYKWILIWENVERKCLKKAEEYK